MSILTYNNVCIPYAHTTKFDQQVLYDEVGGTDWYCTKFDIEVQGVLSVDYVSTILPDISVLQSFGTVYNLTNAADIMSIVRSRLNQPRKKLSFLVGGVDLIPNISTNHPGTVDVKNGPMPQSCSIIGLTASTFLITFRITAHYWEGNLKNNAGSGNTFLNNNGGPVLYNRWTESVTFDNCCFATRNRKGKFVIRSDNPDGLIIDNYRETMAVVGVPNGYLRTAASYTVSPDGLALEYSVTDKQQFKMPPQIGGALREKAYEADGNYYESTATRMDAARFGEVRVRLKGSPATSQDALVACGMAMCAEKIAFRGGAFPQPFSILEFASVRAEFFRNEVECTMKCRIANDMNRLAGFSAFSRLDTYVPRSDIPPNGPGGGAVVPLGGRQYAPIAPQAPDFPTYGFTGKPALQAAAYFDPNVAAAINKVTGQFFGNGIEPGQAGQKLEP